PTAGVYTIRLSQREDGNAIDALILQRSNLAAPKSPGPPESGLAEGFLIGTQPSSVTVLPGKPATFTVVALVAAGATVTYQWQQAAAGSSTFADISGATSASYNIASTTLVMNGTQYRVNVTSGGTTLTSSVATLTTDATPPAVTSLQPISPTFLYLSFSK